MRLVDLFAGIGGFSYAAHKYGITTDLFVEIEPYPKKVLAKNFPKVPIIDDIHDLDKKVYEELTGYKTTDIISGGFPCQPFSLAGKRKGTEDNRFLWGEMFRIIKELKPRWVIAENVYGIVNIQEGLVFETVHTDLEAQGFEVQSFIIPAAGKNAPHRRDRVWFIANSNSNKDRWEIPRGEQRGNSKKWSDEKRKKVRRNDFRFVTNRSGTTHIAKHSNKDELQRGQNTRKDEGKRATSKNITRSTSGYWENFPTQPAICGRNDGIPNRVDRIKALGNSIVPQIAMEIFRSIIESELNNPSRG